MKTLEEVIAELTGTDLDTWRLHSYDDVYGAIGTILAEEYEDDWQGVVYYLLDSGDQYAVAVQSFGSCPDCDELFACNCKDDFTEMVTTIYNELKWVTRAEVIAGLEALLLKESGEVGQTFAGQALEVLNNG